ncbi:hypothetical protein BGW37DRAFT_472124 [Umbelopsis sp. PMI_123]|nr:hypothetical protein BGW37DRAFT_472124 [Umbelopsis sp. PMI_123]
MTALSSEDQTNFLQLSIGDISLSGIMDEPVDNTYGYVHQSSSLPKPPVNPTNSIGEMLWTYGQSYSDIQISLRKSQELLKDTVIPESLQLHSIVLYQSNYFKKLLATPSSMKNLVLGPRKTKEDLVYLYVAIKLMYTKAWQQELNMENAQGVLSACLELEYDEGIRSVNEWLSFTARKSLQVPKEMGEKGHENASMDSGVSDVSSAKSSPRIRAVSVPIPPQHGRKSSAPLVPMNPQELYRQLTSATTPAETKISTMQHHISTFERISHSNLHHCLQRHFDTCFPFDANLYCATMDSILTLQQQQHLSSSEAAKSVIRLMGVMRNDQAHEAQSHSPIVEAMQTGGPIHIVVEPPVVPVAMDVILIEIMSHLEQSDRIEVASFLAGQSVKRNIKHLRQIKGDEEVNWDEIERERSDTNTAWVVTNELNHYISEIL